MTVFDDDTRRSVLGGVRMLLFVGVLAGRAPWCADCPLMRCMLISIRNLVFRLLAVAVAAAAAERACAFARLLRIY